MGWLRARSSDLAVVGPRHGPRRADLLVVVPLVALLLAEAVGGVRFGSVEPRVLPDLVVVALLPWRRVRPLEVALVGFGVLFAFDLLVPPEVVVLDQELVGGSEPVAVQTTTTFAGDLARLVLFYALCRWDALSRVVVGAAVLFVAATVSALVEVGLQLVEVLMVVPWAVLAAFALAMRYRVALRAQHVASVRLAERNALARDVHDVVAHHVSAIAVQAQAAQYVAREDPEQAAAALHAIEELAGTAIDEMRRMVGVLRSDDDEARTVTASTLARLEDQVGTPRVTLTGETSLGHLPSSVAAAAYRIAQEAVTNARRHSRGCTFVDVALRTRPDGIELVVLNDGVPVGRRARAGGEGGWGLVGMSERVSALGGELEAAPRRGGGWSVHASIPLGSATRDAPTAVT